MFNPLAIFKKKVNLKDSGLSPVVLLVLDGWGLAPASPGNPIPMAKTPRSSATCGIKPNQTSLDRLKA